MVIEVPDLPEEAVAALTARAQSCGQSLADYVRDLLTQEAARPLAEDVMTRRASRETFRYETSDLRAFAAEGRS